MFTSRKNGSFFADADGGSAIDHMSLSWYCRTHLFYHVRCSLAQGKGEGWEEGESGEEGKIGEDVGEGGAFCEEDAAFLLELVKDQDPAVKWAGERNDLERRETRETRETRDERREMRDERSLLPPHYIIGLLNTQPPILVLTYPHSPRLPSHFPLPTPHSGFTHPLTQPSWPSVLTPPSPTPTPWRQRGVGGRVRYCLRRRRR